MSETPKIAFFISGLRPGGIGRVIANLSSGFVERGIQVDILVTRNIEAYYEDIHPDVNLINLKTGRVIKSMIPLVSYLKQNQPYTFISANDYVNLVAIWAWKLSGVSAKMVATVHVDRTNIKIPRTFKNRLFRFLVCKTYTKAEHIVAVSSGVAENVSKLFEVPLHVVKVINNPIFDDRIAIKAKERYAHEWLINKKCPVIIAVGRLTRQKDFPTLMRAFKNLLVHRSAKLIILGDGEEKADLLCLSARLGLEDALHFAGFVDNPYSYISRADVLAVSSIYEGFGNVIVEAMALGTTVVSTDCPSGPAEILGNGKYGYLVPVGNSDTMAEAISKAIDTPINVDLLKQRAADYSVSNITNAYLNMIGLN